MSSLPENWVKCKVGDVLSIRNGYAFPSKDYKKDGIPLIRQSNLNGDSVSLQKCVYLGHDYLKNKSDYTVKKGDILIGMSGSIGKLCQYNLDEPALQNQRTGRVVLYDESYLKKQFVWYYLMTMTTQLNEKGHGLGISNVSAKDIETIDFPLPPLNEQRYIVEKLDKLLAKVESAKARLERVPGILKRFRQAVLAAAVSGELTKDWREKNPDIISLKYSVQKVKNERIDLYAFRCEIAKRQGDRKPKKPANLSPELRNIDNEYFIPESWGWISFEDIASTEKYAMSSGPFGSALGRKDYVKEGIPVVRGHNIQIGKFLFDTFVFVSKAKADTLKRSWGLPGDIVVVAVGSSGQAAIIPDSLDICVLSQNCNKITIDPALASKKFVLQFLQNRIAIEQLKDKTTDTARPFLSLTNLKSLLIPLPPLEEQNEIVNRIEALFKIADQVEARYEKAKAHVDKLSQSILAKAFGGELVPQDPNDEPASVLLAKIKSRASMKKAL